MANIKAYLTLIGAEFDTDFATARIGIQPDKVRQKDEVLPNGYLFGKTQWGVYTDKINTDELAPVLRKIIERFGCGTTCLKDLALTCNAEWHLLILLEVYDEERPIIYFPSDVIRFLGEIDAQVGFDDYLFSTKRKKVQVWGSGLYSNQTARDVRAIYQKHLANHMGAQEAYTNTQQDCLEYLWDEDECPLFWYALAHTQWKANHLLPEVKERALYWLERNGGIEAWLETPDRGKSWKKTLTKLQKQLTSPSPEKRR